MTRPATTATYLPRLDQRGAGVSTPLGWLWRCLGRIRERRDLSELDERLLRDIGITHSQALQEVEKPFWR